jgi:hypothetical protein
MPCLHHIAESDNWCTYMYVRGSNVRLEGGWSITFKYCMGNRLGVWKHWEMWEDAINTTSECNPTVTSLHRAGWHGVDMAWKCHTYNYPTCFIASSQLHYPCSGVCSAMWHSVIFFSCVCKLGNISLCGCHEDRRALDNQLLDILHSPH